ncbi:MAG: hypothetical protein ACREFU_18905 [Acetobacteraceae bacterium]
MRASRLHWMRGRTEAGGGEARTVEWVGWDEKGRAVARVVRLKGPLFEGWRLYRAVALDPDGRVVELRPAPPEGAGWLACIGGRVVGRAALPLQAVRTAEAALS